MGKINVDYPGLLKLFPEYINPKRSESASFLIWYLENYYRLDGLEAVDSVCDKRGDKGVDGLFVNDNDKTITVYQSRINQSSDTTIGDASLRAFAGTLSQFNDADSIQNLISSAGNAQVAALAKRLDLANKISTHELRGEFISNVDLDKNGASFLKTHPNISFIGKTALESSYISDERAKVAPTNIKSTSAQPRSPLLAVSTLVHPGLLPLISKLTKYHVNATAVK